MAPVVITLVTDGAWCLLARQSSFPKGLYSALAGFCDIGEGLREEPEVPRPVSIMLLLLTNMHPHVKKTFLELCMVFLHSRRQSFTHAA